MWNHTGRKVGPVSSAITGQTTQAIRVIDAG